ncbi:MAG: hypothetical protein AAF645_22700 [Myxococcota bacterium]
MAAPRAKGTLAKLGRHVAFALAVVALSFAPSSARADDEEDDTLIYLRLQGGVAYANLLSLDDDEFLPEVASTSGTGPFIGGAAGFRFLVFTLGLQYNHASHGDFRVNDADLEFAVHIPIPFVQPFVRLAFGYAWITDDFQGVSNDANIRGLRAAIGAGIDIRVHRNFSFGAGVDVGVVSLSREGVDVAGATSFDFTEEGRAVGLQVRGQAHLTVHI